MDLQLGKQKRMMYARVFDRTEEETCSVDAVVPDALGDIGAIVVAVVLVLALIAGALGGKAGFLTNLDGIVRAPLQKAATVTAQWLESIYGYIYKYDQLKAENEQLRTQLAEAQAQAREGQEAIAENERYRDLLGFTQRHTDFELEPANVVSYGASNWSSTLTLSKAQLLHEDDPYRTNTAEAPEAVTPQPLDIAMNATGTCTATLPAISWISVEFHG